MDNINNYAKNLKKIRLANSLSQAQMAAKLGISPNGYANYESGKRIPPADIILKISQMWDVDANWLLTTSGSMYLNKCQKINDILQQTCGNADISKVQKFIVAASGQNVSQMGISSTLGLEQSSITGNNNEELCYIPAQGDVTASLGSGCEVFSEEVTEKICFPKSLFKQIGANPEHSCIINTSGESMYPTIIGGKDQIMIDLSQKEIFDGKIYLIRMDNDLFAKRLQKLPNRKLKIISDNKNYESYIIDLKDESLNFDVIGRVVWLCRNC